jgi:hypothetical protein
LNLSEILEIETAVQDVIEFVGTDKIEITQWDTVTSMDESNYDEVYEETINEYYAEGKAFYGYASTSTDPQNYDEEGSGVQKPYNMKVITTEKELRRVGLIVNDVLLLTEKDVVTYKGKTYNIVHVEERARLVDQSIVVYIWGYDGGSVH